MDRYGQKDRAEDWSSGPEPREHEKSRVTGYPDWYHRGYQMPYCSERFRSWNHQKTSVNYDRDRAVLMFPVEVTAIKGRKIMEHLDNRGVKLQRSAIDGIMTGNPMEYVELFVLLYNLNVHENYNLFLDFVSPEYLKKLFQRMARGDLSVRVSCMYELLNKVFNLKQKINQTQFLQHRYTLQKMEIIEGVISMLADEYGEFKNPLTLR